MLGTGANICNTGMNVAGMTETVYVGQQIALTGCPPAGTAVTTRAWSAPPGTANGGYAGLAQGVCTAGSPPSVQQGGCVVNLPATNTDGFTFYWVDSGNGRKMSYSYTTDGGPSPGATVTFNVLGPANPSIATQIGAPQR